MLCDAACDWLPSCSLLFSRAPWNQILRRNDMAEFLHSLDPERTSRCFGLGADIKNFAPELRSNNSSGLRSGTVCWWVAPPHQCVTTMKSVSFPVSWLNPLSETINEEAGVSSSEMVSTVSWGISC